MLLEWSVLKWKEKVASKNKNQRELIALVAAWVMLDYVKSKSSLTIFPALLWIQIMAIIVF